MNNCAVLLLLTVGIKPEPPARQASALTITSLASAKIVIQARKTFDRRCIRRGRGSSQFLHQRAGHHLRGRRNQSHEQLLEICLRN